MEHRTSPTITPFRLRSHPSGPVLGRLRRAAAGLLIPLAMAAATGLPNAAAAETRLDVGVSTPVDRLTPHPLYQGTMPWIHAIFDALVRWEGGPQPQLAESWDLSADGRSLVLRLRPGVTFHDGKPLTAEMVVKNLVWATDPANRVTGSVFLSTGTYTAVDDMTVKLEYPISAPQILTVLAVLPIMDLDSDIVSKPNGTGPFVVSEFTPSTSIVLTRNPNYWDKDRTPQIDTLAFPTFADNASLQAALQSGQIDVLAFPGFRTLATLQSQGMTLVSDTPPGNFMIRVRTTAPPLDNALVRRALSHTINREVFAKLMTNGLSTPTCSHLPPASPAYTAETEDSCAYDLELAKKLLAEAGHPDGLELEYLASTVRQPELTGFVPIWQEDLAKIGVKLTINDLAPSALSTLVREGKFQLTGDWYPWGVFDPAVFFIGPSFAPNNISGYENAAYQGLLDQAQAEADAAKRTDLYKQVNRLLAEESFIIPIASRPYIYAVRPDVADFKLDPFGMASFDSVTVK